MTRVADAFQIPLERDNVFMDDPPPKEKTKSVTDEQPREAPGGTPARPDPPNADRTPADRPK
jgi:hypothetical protein